MQPRPGLAIVSAATLAGGSSANQDHVVLVDGAVAVLDGATSLLPHDPSRDGGWYARALGSQLALLLPGRGRQLTDLMAEAIERVRDAYDVGSNGPRSTASVVRWNEQSVEALVLADSPVVVLSVDGEPEVVHDDRLGHVAEDIRAAVHSRLRSGSGYDATVAQLLRDLQKAERAVCNSEHGFWVAGADPEAALHAVTRSWPRADVGSALVLTDGAAAGVMQYGIADWPTVAQQVLERGPSVVVAAVHAAEMADPDGRRWPRYKRHDDKTVVGLDFLTLRE